MKKQSLLVIDAETLLGEFIQLTFDPLRVEVVLANSAEEGLRLLEEYLPDLVLIDPSIEGGLQLLERLSVRLKPSQVIAITASDLMRRIARKLDVEVIDKGGRLSELTYAIRQHLGVETLLQRSGEQVLVVDDDPDVRETVMRFLETWDYAVIGASSGADALSAVDRDDSIAVMLLDVSMPGMGGIVTLREMKKHRRHPTAIMLSGVADEEIARQAIELGAFDYILKPPDLDRVEATVSACFSRLRYRNSSFWKKSFWFAEGEN